MHRSQPGQRLHLGVQRVGEHAHYHARLCEPSRHGGVVPLLACIAPAALRRAPAAGAAWPGQPCLSHAVLAVRRLQKRWQENSKHRTRCGASGACQATHAAGSGGLRAGAGPAPTARPHAAVAEERDGRARGRRGRRGLAAGRAGSRRQVQVEHFALPRPVPAAARRPSAGAGGPDTGPCGSHAVFDVATLDK